jgi:hypothetical protein
MDDAPSNFNAHRPRIMNRPAGFSAMASLNTARAWASCRQIAWSL